MLNTTSPLPLYQQLADIISEKVINGDYPPGTRLPSEHEMAKHYNIGRPTVRQATEVLVRKGVLRRKRGAGTFVQNEHREVDLFSLAGTLSSFQKKGISVVSHIVNRIRLITVHQDAANPFFDQNAYFFPRVSRVDNEPVLLEDIYLHPGLFSGIDKFDLTGRSLSQIVSDYFYLKPTGGRQHFRIAYPNAARARLLGVSKETPVLALNRFIDFPDVPNGVYSDLFCRTDRFVFSQKLGGIQDEN
ncbi:MAG: GntR family transcriptional regulator [Desulfobacterales bacterium]